MRLVERSDADVPAPGQLRVRMLMAPVNPADRLTIAGLYRPLDELPEILGAEGVGIVEEAGEGVSALRAGDRVILLSRGNWVERRLVQAGEALRVPPSLPIEQAAMLRINPGTARRMLDRLDLRAGQWLVQNAPTSSVAHWVRRLAALRGLRVLNVGRAGAADERDLLADGGDLPERAAAVTGSEPIAAALDAVAGAMTGRLAACLDRGGRILVYGHLSGEPCLIPSTLLTTRELAVSGFSLRPAEAGEASERRAALYAELAELAAQAPEPVAGIFPLDEVEAAVAAAGAAGRKGRVLLRLDA